MSISPEKTRPTASVGHGNTPALLVRVRGCSLSTNEPRVVTRPAQEKRAGAPSQAPARNLPRENSRMRPTEALAHDHTARAAENQELVGDNVLATTNGASGDA